MKKFLVFLISFVFLGLIALAQTPEENFQKAGEAELAKREAILPQKKAEIEKFFGEMANDAIISGKEMKTLKKMVEDFDETQKQFNKELGFYGLKTITAISPIIRELLDVYYGIGKKRNEKLLNDADNSGQDIRHFFTQQTGQDIRVEKSSNYLMRFIFGLIVGLFVAWACLLCLADGDVGNIWTWCFIFIVFALVLITFLVLL